MPPKRFYHFCYFAKKQTDRELQLHHLRDGHAALEVADILFEHGYQYGGLIFNYPSNNGQTRHTDVSFLTSSDLLVLTTRPPLDDEDEQSRRTVDRSHTSLENRIFETLRNYFRYCSRSEVLLSERLTARFPAEADAKHKRSVSFKNYSVASYIGSDDTAFYLIFVPHCWQDGPGLLCAFGMGGPETLIWTHLLRTLPDLRKLVGTREFVIAEAVDRKIRMPVDDLRFTDKWSVKIAVEVRFAASMKAF